MVSIEIDSVRDCTLCSSPLMYLLTMETVLFQVSTVFTESMLCVDGLFFRDDNNIILCVARINTLVIPHMVE